MPTIIPPPGHTPGYRDLQQLQQRLQQRAQVGAALLARAGGRLRHPAPEAQYWDPARGPGEWAGDLVRRDGDDLPARDRALLLAAWALWTGRGRLTVAELLADLPADDLRVVASLLAAVADGPEAIDGWLAAQGTPRARPGAP